MSNNNDDDILTFFSTF